MRAPFKSKMEKVFIYVVNRLIILREMRQVKEGEQPAKKILSLVGNGEQLVDLFGIWQTEPFENKLRDDGSLPKNEYGNYEIFNGELPEGVVYINLPSLPRLCRKLGFDYVEAVTGKEIISNFV